MSLFYLIKLVLLKKVLRAWCVYVEKVKRGFFQRREQNLYSELRVKCCDLVPIFVADPNVSRSKMTKINCPLELEGS